MARYSEEILNAAKTLHITEDELDKAYTKGMIAWSEGHVPGSTPQQLGMAVVEQFILLKTEQIIAIKEEQKRKEKSKQFKDMTEDKKSKKTKKDDDKNDTKYSNQQPGPTFSSARTGGISGNFSSAMDEENYTGSEAIKTWALSESIQSLYIKKYGKNAEARLLEAVQKLNASLNVVKIEGNTPPQEPIFEGGPKRKAYSLLEWHKMKLVENREDTNLVEWHNKKIVEYTRILKGKPMNEDTKYLTSKDRKRHDELEGRYYGKGAELNDKEMEELKTLKTRNHENSKDPFVRGVAKVTIGPTPQRNPEMFYGRK